MKPLNKKILIIEDEKQLSDILKERFASEGFEVVIAENGEAGLSTALAEKPDLILLDLLMPKKDGLSMLKDLRATEEGAHIPVIPLTNFSDATSLNETLKLGVKDYIVKAETEIDDIVKVVRSNMFA